MEKMKLMLVAVSEYLRTMAELQDEEWKKENMLAMRSQIDALLKELSKEDKGDKK